jgi:hypothetical protein
MERCTHTDQIRDVQPSAQGCEECLEIGDTWVHLRECLVCAHVGCCDSSKPRRNRRRGHAPHRARPRPRRVAPGGLRWDEPLARDDPVIRVYLAGSPQSN